MIEKKRHLGDIFQVSSPSGTPWSPQSGLGAGLKECDRRAMSGRGPSAARGRGAGPMAFSWEGTLPSIRAHTYAWPSIFPSNHPVTPLVSQLLSKAE